MAPSAAVARIAAEFPNARLWDPWSALAESLCAPGRDELILYADRSHLSVNGSRALAPAAAPHLGWLVR